MSVRLNLYGERSKLDLLQRSKTKNNNLSSNAIFQRRCTMVHLLRSKWQNGDLQMNFSIYQDRRSAVRLKSLATSSIDLQLNEVYFMQLYKCLYSFFFFSINNCTIDFIRLSPNPLYFILYLNAREKQEKCQNLVY